MSDDMRDNYDDEPLMTLTALRKRREGVQANVKHLLDLVAALEAHRMPSPSDCAWLLGGIALYRRYGGPIERWLGLTGAPGSHFSGRTLLRVVDDDDPPREEGEIDGNVI